MAPLTGSELLAQVKELGQSTSKSELARACGYVSSNDGKERVNFTAFYEALLLAKGVFGEQETRPGRRVSYQTKVQFNGNLMIGGAYTRLAGYQPGDVFRIRPTKSGFSLVRLSSGPNGHTEDGGAQDDAPQEPTQPAQVAEVIHATPVAVAA